MSLYDNALIIMGGALGISWYYVYTYYSKAKWATAIAAALLEGRIEVITEGDTNEDV